MSNFFHASKQNGLTVTEKDLQDTCFQYYDRDEDGGLNLKEFGSLCRDLLSDSSGKPYPLQIRMQADMFYVFDQNKDGKVDEEEFSFMWNQWIKKVLFPVTTLLIVDVQNDFISGSLAIHRCPAGHMGEEVVPVINKMIETISFNETIYTLDWHPEDHISFINNVDKRPIHSPGNINPEEIQVYDTVIFEGPPNIEQKLWPAHCIQGSWGSELHPNLKIVDNPIFVHKGTNSEIDSYSAFWDNQKRSETSLNSEIHSRGITDVFICGIAYDICVASTARHAIENGYRTYLVDDACRGVSNEDINDMIKKLLAQGALLVQSDDVLEIAMGKDRRLEMGYRSAMKLAATLQDNGASD